MWLWREGGILVHFLINSSSFKQKHVRILMCRPCRLVDFKVVPWRWLGMAVSIWLWGIDTWPLRSSCSCCRDMILSSHGRSTWCGCLEDVESFKDIIPEWTTCHSLWTWSTIHCTHLHTTYTLQGRNYTTWVETAILYIAKRRVMCSKPLHRDPKDTPKFNFRLRGKGCPTNQSEGR